jgi:hypothetical protein
VAGQYLPQYEIYWNRLDPGDSGRVAPLDAATFLKSSGLSDQTLGKVIFIMYLFVPTYYRYYFVL